MFKAKLNHAFCILLILVNNILFFLGIYQLALKIK